MTTYHRLRIEDLSLQYNGASTKGTQRIEVPCTLPGEIVDTDIVKTLHGVQYGLPTHLYATNARRVTADCQHFGQCGACHLRHVRYKDSANLKAQVFYAHLRKMLKDTNNKDHVPMDQAIALAPHPIGYRNNARFDLQNGTINQHTLLTHDHFVVSECHVLPRYILTFAQDLARTLPSHVSRMELRYNDLGDIMAILHTENPSYVPDLQLHAVYVVHTSTKSFRHISGEPTLTYSMDVMGTDFAFAVGPKSFFQVQTAMAAMLYGYLHEQVPTSGNILDLYAGTGTIGIILATLAEGRTVTSVEIEPEMTALALQNGVHVLERLSCVTGDVRSTTFPAHPASIIVDPPRSGLSVPSLKHLLSLESPQLVYISCSPTSLLRDLQHILPLYRITALQLFDMMPYTSHVETVVVLTKK